MTAPEDTAQVVDASFAEDFERRLTDAWNSHRAERVTALSQPDVLWEDPTVPGGHLVGHDALVDYLQTIWRAGPDLMVVSNGPIHMAVDGRSVMTDWIGTGTFTGPLDPPGFAPTGQKITLTGTDRYWFRDGLLSHVRTVSDTMALARQIGAAPREGSRAEKFGTVMQRLSARRMRRKVPHG